MMALEQRVVARSVSRRRVRNPQGDVVKDGRPVVSVTCGSVVEGVK